MTSQPLNRRALLTSMGALLLSRCAPRGLPSETTPKLTAKSEPPRSPPAETPSSEETQNESEVTLRPLEANVGGRIGLFAVQPSSGKTLRYRADERFAMCSTFKWALAAVVLRAVEQGQLSFDQFLPFSAADLQEYAPVTRAHIAEGRLSVEALLQATVSVSDNTATNLLLAQVGGPAAVTAFFRELGDPISRLDRNEPMLNMNTAGDERDTTSPRAMALALQATFTRNVLSNENQVRLQQWLIDAKTGLGRLRAGLPPTWKAGDKTGTGNRGACNDVAVLWPPSGEPWFVAAYLSDSDAPLESLNAVHADIARLVVARDAA